MDYFTKIHKSILNVNNHFGMIKRRLSNLDSFIKIIKTNSLKIDVEFRHSQRHTKCRLIVKNYLIMWFWMYYSFSSVKIEINNR
jgi:hypothetical protein